MPSMISFQNSISFLSPISRIHSANLIVDGFVINSISFSLSYISLISFSDFILPNPSPTYFTVITWTISMTKLVFLVNFTNTFFISHSQLQSVPSVLLHFWQIQQPQDSFSCSPVQFLKLHSRLFFDIFSTPCELNT